MQELHLRLFSFLARVVLTNFTSSTVSVHSSINRATNFFLHLKFLKSKYSLKLQALSHGYSQLLGFQAFPLSHIPLSINSLHSHRYLSLFQRCLLLQTIASNLHLH